MASQGSAETIRAERVDFEAMVEAIASTGARFVDLLRGLDPSDGERPVPGLRWTVAETATHMLNIVHRGTDDFRRADSVPGLAELNQQCIDETETRELAELGAALEHELGRMLRGLRRLDAATAASTLFPLHAGLTTDVPSALSYALLDLLVHGDDIARATGKEWRLEPNVAALSLHAGIPAMGPWLKDEVRAGTPQRLSIGFPNDGDAIDIRVGDGRYSARNDVRGTDCVEVDPAAALLAIAGRKPASAPAVQRLAGWFEPV